MGIESKIASDVSVAAAKVASGVSIGGGLSMWLASLADKIRGNEGAIGLLIAAIGLLIQLIIGWRKERREQAEHQAKMLLLEIQIEEEEGSRGD